jgi:L-ascorbate metabolism protein UlaG (beta-lactamase superfamily)
MSQSDGQSTSDGFEVDTLTTASGDVVMTFLGHGSLMFAFGGKIIQVDPYSKVADYAKLPKADLILLTHEHVDHLDPGALGAVRRSDTIVIANQEAASKVSGAIVMRNGESRDAVGVGIEAIPAYNIVSKRPDGQAFHPKGSGNGYLLTFGNKRVYVAGDTENTPEMKKLTAVDVAFLPMNQPYTMTPEMVADAARAFRPKVLYPYHFAGTDPGRLTSLLANEKGIEVRVRRLE